MSESARATSASTAGGEDDHQMDDHHTLTLTSPETNNVSVAPVSEQQKQVQQQLENGKGDLFMGNAEDENKNIKDNWDSYLDTIDDVENGLGNETRSRWDLIEPSPSNLNKLDGWGHRKSAKEDDYHEHVPVDFNDHPGKKPRVRWADVQIMVENGNNATMNRSHQHRESTETK